MWIRISLLAGLFCLLLQPAAAEPREEFNNAHGDFFRLYSPDFRNLSLSYLYQPETEEDGGAGEFDLGLFEADLQLPFPTGRDTYFSLTAGFESRDYEFVSVSGAITDVESETFYGVPIGAEIGIFTSDDFFFTASTTVGVYSNLDDSLEEDDIQVFGDLIAVYRLNPGALILGGARVDNTFEDVRIYPLVGLRIRSTSGKLHISLTIPKEVTVTYSSTYWLDLFGGLSVDGNDYRARGLGTAPDFNVYVRDIRVGGGLRLWLGEYINLGVEGGTTVESVYEYKVSGAGQFFGDLDPAPFVKGTLSFKL